MAKRLRIAWFSKLNLDGQDSSSLSAHFSETILPLLRDRFEIELFHDRFNGATEFKTHHYLKAQTVHRRNPFDLFFYNFEDRKDLDFVRLHLGLVPGIVLFNDFFLVSDGPEPILNSAWTKTIELFNQVNSNSLAQLNWPDRSLEYKRPRPQAFREAGLSLVSLFSDQRCSGEYLRSIETKLDCQVNPRTFYLPVPIATEQVTHQSTPSGRTRIGFCGSAQIEHRAHKLLEALSALKVPTKLIWLVEDAAAAAVARKLVKEFEIQEFEIVLGLSPKRWATLLPNLDLAVHTLFSVYGQTGPYLPLSMLAKKPVVVTQFGSSELIPDNLVFKIEPGRSEACQIRLVLEEVIPRLDQIDLDRGYNYALENHDRRVVAAELIVLFEKIAPELQASIKSWNRFSQLARAELLRESAEYIPNSAKTLWGKGLSSIFEELGWGVYGE